MRRRVVLLKARLGRWRRILVGALLGGGVLAVIKLFVRALRGLVVVLHVRFLWNVFRVVFPLSHKGTSSPSP
jgi:hypothetical protein